MGRLSSEPTRRLESRGELISATETTMGHLKGRFERAEMSLFFASTSDVFSAIEGKGLCSEAGRRLRNQATIKALDHN
jgi:hypothetical protein